MFRMLFAAIILAENSANSVIRIIGPQEKPAKYVYEQGCYLKSLDQMIPFNSTHSPTNHSRGCVQYFCDYDSYIYVTECINSFEGDCMLVKGNTSLPYPYCCDFCDPSHKKTNSVPSTSETISTPALSNINQNDLNTINITNNGLKPEAENKETEILNAETINKNLDKVENDKNKENVNKISEKQTTKSENQLTDIISIDESKTASKSESEIQNIPDNKSKNNLETESGKKSDTQPDNQTEAQTENKPKNISVAETENKSGTKSDNKLETAIERIPDTPAENTAEPQLESEREDESERISKNEASKTDESKPVEETILATKPKLDKKSINNEVNKSKANLETNPEINSEPTTDSNAKN